MKIYYVDAENVGINFLADEKVSVFDKVYVFSNNESFKLECERRFYTYVTGYPEGKNQADFHMVSHLSRMIFQLSNKEKGSVTFIFCSEDKDLLKALYYQSSLFGIKLFSSYPTENNKIQARIDCQKVNKSTGLEGLILRNLSKPSKAIDIQNVLRVTKSEFTNAFNKLIKVGKIKRLSRSSKKWSKA